MTIIVRVNKVGRATVQGICIEIFPYTRRKPITCIRVYKDRHYATGRWKPAEAGWPALGAENQKRTGQFGRGLLVAAKAIAWLDWYVASRAPIHTPPIKKCEIIKGMAAIKKEQLG